MNPIDTWQEVPKQLLAKEGTLYPAHWRLDVQCPRLNSVGKWNAINVDDPVSVSKSILDIVVDNTRIVDTRTNTEIDSKHIYEHDKMILLFLIFDKFNTENKREHNVFAQGQCSNPQCREHYPKLIVQAANFRCTVPDSKYDQFIDTSLGLYKLPTKDFGEIVYKPSTIGLGEVASQWVMTLEPKFIQENMDVIEAVQALCTDFTDVNAEVLRKLQIGTYNLWSDEQKKFYLNLINRLTIKIEGALSYTCAKCKSDFRTPIPYGQLNKEMFVDVQSFDDQLFGQLDLDNKEHISDANRD